MSMHKGEVITRAQAHTAQARRLYLHYSNVTKEQIDLACLKKDFARLVRNFEEMTNDIARIES